MTLLLSAQNIAKSYGGRQLFKFLSFGIFQGDKIGLIGPNGSGKSTLLKILAGIDEADEGSISKNRFLRIGYVPQETLFKDCSIEEILLDAFPKDSHLSMQQMQTQTAITLSKLGFIDHSVLANSLSGGWQKRLAMARELVLDPEVLFLDEPTNHLDLEGVIWLENFLKQSNFAYVVISHDRYFLEHITTRMMELNKAYPKGLFFAEGSYSLFLEKREDFLSGQLQQERSLNSKVRREVEWLKQNPKARTTKSSSRIQEANRLIDELKDLKGRHKQEKTQIDFSSSKKESQKLLVATNLSKSLGGRELFSGITLTLTPGMRLGIVGSNGSGKTTFLRLLAGELAPDKGTIKRADGLNTVYFDQHRAQLAGETTLRRALSPGGDTVTYRGQSIHVNSWCKRFLFSPDRLDLPFSQLSGGERARVHIARLMLQEADILLLDEPTNDLDIQTLEVLEQSLQDFPGAIVLISHDRYMLDQISNVILGLGSKSDTTLFADYRQWEQHQSLQEKSKVDEVRREGIEKKASSGSSKKTRKKSYNEKRELEQMEGKIMILEEEIETLEKNMLSLLDQPQEVQKICEHLASKQKMREQLYQRWEELESME